jgi:hypothetical protein
MLSAESEFIINATLLGLVNLLTFAIFVLVGLTQLVVSRKAVRLGRTLIWGGGVLFGSGVVWSELSFSPGFNRVIRKPPEIS